ncbi:MAG: acyltransferase [Clostridia bacterium]|nr:acyltransferase [Clostridia bacterium]
MLMVVALHATNTNAEYGLGSVAFADPYQPHAVFSLLLRAVSLVAVDCFVLITGYFLCTADARVSKALKLWITVFIYSFGFYLLLCIVPFSSTKLSFDEAIRSAFPVVNRGYWFFTAYIILYLLSPFLNRLISSISERDHRILLMILFVLFVILTSVFGDQSEANGGYSLCWFIILYLTASYLRKHPLRKLPYGWIYLALSLLQFGVMLLRVGLKEHPNAENHLASLASYNSILVFPAAVSLFMFFLQHPIKSKGKMGKAISKIASLTFGVYLLHEHPYLRPIIWNKLVCFDRFVDTPLKFIAVMIGAVIAIFAAGILTEWIRTLVFRPIDRRIDEKLKQTII